MSEQRVRAHVFVTGKVQGVFFRASTREKAQDCGVDGWVQNLDDGRVEAVFAGPTSAVETMIEWCHTGPPAASAQNVDVQYTAVESESGFRIKR